VECPLLLATLLVLFFAGGPATRASFCSRLLDSFLDRNQCEVGSVFFFVPLLFFPVFFFLTSGPLLPLTAPLLCVVSFGLPLLFRVPELIT